MASYENALNQAQYINFFPYIGEGYCSTYPKILVLGHSHYASNESPDQTEENNTARNLTREVILDDYLATLEDNGGKTHPYPYVRCFRYMAAVLTGEDYHSSDYIWKNLAFANFFQKIIGLGPRSREFWTQELAAVSCKAFFEILGILKPDFVIAWGKELFFNDLPHEGFTVDHDLRVGRYKNFPETLIWGMKHPSSSSFSYPNEHKNWLKIKTLADSLLL